MMKLNAAATGVFQFLTAGLALYALLSGSWVWTRTNEWQNWSSSSTSMGTGPYIASFSSHKVNSIWGHSWSAYYLWFSDTSDQACASSMSVIFGTPQVDSYNLFGQYGFCTGQNGSFQVPAELKRIQAFMMVSTVLGFVTSFLGCAAGRAGKSLTLVCAVFSFLAGGFAVAAFSQAAAFQYYKDLRRGMAGLIIPSGNGYVLLDSEKYGMWWGPGFFMAIAVAILEFIITGLFLRSTTAPAEEKEPSFENMEFDLEAMEQQQQPPKMEVEQQTPQIPVVNATPVANY